MRWIPFLVFATLAPICLAEAAEIQGCGHDGAVACFVDHAQDRLRSCSRSSSFSSDAVGTDGLQGREGEATSSDKTASPHRIGKSTHSTAKH